MRAEVGSIWRTSDIASVLYEVIGHTVDDKIRVRAKDYPASLVKAYYPEDFHRNFTLSKPAPIPAIEVEIGSIWRSRMFPDRMYVVESVHSQIGFRLIPKNGDRSFTYTYEQDRFFRSLEWVQNAETVKVPRTAPEVGSVWSTKSGSVRYVVTGVDVDRGNPNDPRWWNVSFTVEGKGIVYRYNAPRFWSLLKLVEPAPDKWAEVERTLKAYNEANREGVRLKAMLEEAYDSVNRAREAISAHRTVSDTVSAAYSEALRKMEEDSK